MKPIDRTKKSNRRCWNCVHYQNRKPNPTHVGRPGWHTGPEDICPIADNKLIDYWNCCRLFAWNPAKQYTEPLKDMIRIKLEEYRQKALELGITLNIDENIFIDDNHLDCFWYGGYIGSIEYDDWKIIIEVNGYVHAYIAPKNGNDESYYINRDNSGAWGKNICDFISGDLQKQELTQNKEMIFNHNNWVEWRIQPPGKDVYDPITQFDNILDDNVLEAFNDLRKYVRIIRQCKSPEMMKYFN